MRRALAAGCWLLAAGCASYPTPGFTSPSKQRVAAIRAGLSRNAAELDILQQHVAVEQAMFTWPTRGVDVFAGQMEAAFSADLEASVAIDLERWNARHFDRRLKEWATRLWEYWL